MYAVADAIKMAHGLACLFSQHATVEPVTEDLQLQVLLEAWDQLGVPPQLCYSNPGTLSLLIEDHLAVAGLPAGRWALMLNHTRWQSEAPECPACALCGSSLTIQLFRYFTTLLLRDMT